jgi:hypothetical protein
MRKDTSKSHRLVDSHLSAALKRAKIPQADWHDYPDIADPGFLAWVSVDLCRLRRIIFERLEAAGSAREAARLAMAVANLDMRIAKLRSMARAEAGGTGVPPEVIIEAPGRPVKIRRDADGRAMAEPDE